MKVHMFFHTEMEIVLKAKGIRKKVVDYIEKQRERLSDEALQYGMFSRKDEIDKWHCKIQICGDNGEFTYDISMIKPELGGVEEDIIHIKVHRNVPFHHFAKEFPIFLETVLGITIDDLTIDKNHADSFRAWRNNYSFLSDVYNRQFERKKVQGHV